jgi:hypothetical protein
MGRIVGQSIALNATGWGRVWAGTDACSGGGEWRHSDYVPRGTRIDTEIERD